MSPDRYFELVNEELRDRYQWLLSNIRFQYLNRDATINWGKYAGRRGRITWIGFIVKDDFPEVHVMCQPYRQYRKGLETVTDMDPQNLLWDHIDARSYVPISRVSILE